MVDGYIVKSLEEDNMLGVYTITEVEYSDEFLETGKGSAELLLEHLEKLTVVRADKSLDKLIGCEIWSSARQIFIGSKPLGNRQGFSRVSILYPIEPLLE